MDYNPKIILTKFYKKWILAKSAEVKFRAPEKKELRKMNTKLILPEMEKNIFKD